MGVAAWSTAVLLLAAGASAERTLQAASPTPQISIPYNPQYPDPARPLPLSNYLFQRNATGLDPEQIHITYVSYSSVFISWATGEGLQYASAPGEEGNPGIASEVFYGTQPSEYTNNASGYTTSYSQIYTQLNGTWPLINYSSPVLHHVELTGLLPKTKYYYMAGDALLGMSQEYAFTTAPLPSDPYPLRLGIVADVGETFNATVTMQHLQDAKPQFWTLIGDHCYADDSAANGTSATSNGTVTSYLNPAPSGTYQPRWDAYFRWLEPLFATTPFLPQHGNHELEPQGNASYGKVGGLDPSQQFSSGRQFQSYINRFPVPYTQAGSGSPLWYSANLGPAHMVYLSNYAPFRPGTDQYEWLVQDLASYDRSATPFLIATLHAPWYSSYTTHYMENQCMREAMESVLYEAGVDLMLYGHLHTYERSYPVYNYTRDPCGPVHITLGDGGNIEGLYKVFVDQAGNCPTPGKIPAYQPGGYCPEASFPYDGQYCPAGQPEWSAFRQPAYGHATLDFLNSTTALYQMNRNIDDESVIADSFYLVRDLSCPNKASYPPAATVSSAGK